MTAIYVPGPFLREAVVNSSPGLMKCKMQSILYHRMGKARDLLKSIRDSKGTFHAKMGLIKDRNGMNLTEAEDIKKRWQEYTEKLYEKDLHDPDNHDDGITTL